MREVLTHLKNGKAANDTPAVYLKYAAQPEKLIDEMVRLYSLGMENPSNTEVLGTL